MEEHDIGGGPPGTVMRDVTLAIASVFLVLFLILLLSQLVKKTSESKTELNIKMPGNLMIWIRWPDIVDVDVDLWAGAPGEAAVGYSNPRGVTFSLLRDDLGAMGDRARFNYEVMFARDTPDGDYSINVHLFRNASHLTEIPVETDVLLVYGEAMLPIFKKRTVILKFVGQEITVAAFTFSGGKLSGTIRDDFVPLRAATAAPSMDMGQ